MEKDKPYDDPSNWEYDGGDPNFTGDFNKLPPNIQKLANKLHKEAFPEGVEAFQKQQAAMGNKLIHEAIIFASRKHNGMERKGTDIPYISHPMEVMQILTANKCSAEVIAAGILHDTLEDTDATHEEIKSLFGDKILEIVAAESEDKSKTWKERKQATIDELKDASFDVRLVCCADKLSNIRSMAADQEAIGEKLWERFNAPKNEIEWYYRSISTSINGLSSYDMYRELNELIEKVWLS